ncbi:hypothetical protein EI94DRAFT_1731245, partial [Lactarius quietus]
MYHRSPQGLQIPLSAYHHTCRRTHFTQPPRSLRGRPAPACTRPHNHLLSPCLPQLPPHRAKL